MDAVPALLIRSSANWFRNFLRVRPLASAPAGNVEILSEVQTWRLKNQASLGHCQATPCVCGRPVACGAELSPCLVVQPGGGVGGWWPARAGAQGPQVWVRGGRGAGCRSRRPLRHALHRDRVPRLVANELLPSVICVLIAERAQRLRLTSGTLGTPSWEQACASRGRPPPAQVTPGEAEGSGTGVQCLRTLGRLLVWPG